MSFFSFIDLDLGFFRGCLPTGNELQPISHSASLGIIIEY